MKAVSLVGRCTYVLSISVTFAPNTSQGIGPPKDIIIVALIWKMKLPNGYIESLMPLNIGSSSGWSD